MTVPLPSPDDTDWYDWAQQIDDQGRNAVRTTRTIATGAGLSGGGDLSADRTLSVSFGTTSTTATRGDDARFTTVTASTQTASYVPVLADAGSVIEMNVVGGNTVTIPPNSSVAFPIGTVIEVCQVGTGQTTISFGSGVTLQSPTSTFTTRTQYSSVSARKRGTNVWLLAGDLT